MSGAGGAMFLSYSSPSGSLQPSDASLKVPTEHGNRALTSESRVSPKRMEGEERNLNVPVTAMFIKR